MKSNSSIARPLGNPAGERHFSLQWRRYADKCVGRQNFGSGAGCQPAWPPSAGWQPAPRTSPLPKSLSAAALTGLKEAAVDEVAEVAAGGKPVIVVEVIVDPAIDAAPASFQRRRREAVEGAHHA